MTALITSALLFAGSIDALKSAVVLTSLPFSLILLCMMWGLHKAFYLESQRQIAQMHSLAPFAQSRRGRGGWRQRLSQAVHSRRATRCTASWTTWCARRLPKCGGVRAEGPGADHPADPSHDNVSLKSAMARSSRSSTRCRCVATSRRRSPWVGWVRRS
jgi:choline/glycine/proline betaine transport protein